MKIWAELEGERKEFRERNGGEEEQLGWGREIWKNESGEEKLWTGAWRFPCVRSHFRLVYFKLSKFYVSIIALGCISVNNQSINTYIHV